MKKLIKFIINHKLLIVIVTTASLLRLIGTYPGYNQFHADEGISYSAASSMIVNHNLDPLRYDYPALVPLINYIFFRFVFIPLSWCLFFIHNISGILDGVIHIPIAPLDVKRIFTLYIIGERFRNALFWGRYVTAIFSIGNVILIYLLAKKLFNKNIALIAALLLTFNFKHVINSHIGLPDIYNAFFVLLTILAAFNLWKKPSSKAYLIAGLAGGLSFSVKYQFFAIFPIMLAHIYYAFEAKSRKEIIQRLINYRIVLTGLMFILTFVLINPYHLLRLENTIEIVKGVSGKYAVGVKKLNIYPLSYFYHIDYGPLEFFVVVIGLFWSIFKFPKKTLLLLSHLVPFMFMMLYYSGGGFYIRNFITTTPILFIFAGIFLADLFILIKRLVGPKIGLLIFIILLFGIIYIPGKNAIINSYSYTKPWGYDIMRPWIQQNLPKNVIVATHPFDAVNLGIKNKTTEFEIGGAYSLEEHKENGASYLVLDLNWAGNPFYFWMSYPLSDLSLYWNKPLDIMRNTYHGIATEEFFRYQLYSVTKPWQAPDTHLIIVKFPEWPKQEMVNIKNFGFDKDTEGWSIYWGEYGETKFTFDPSVGSSSKGSILFEPGGSKFSTVRITSMPIPVKGGHLYQINGLLKTEKKLDTRERDGFIRVDFYEDNPNLKNVGINSAVSGRVYGTNGWAKKEITERAPNNVKFLTVSFQTYITTKSKIWLDDVNVLESKNMVEDISSKAPYNNKIIDLNYVYPNSHGNL